MVSALPELSHELKPRAPKLDYRQHRTNLPTFRQTLPLSVTIIILPSKPSGPTKRVLFVRLHGRQ